MKNFLYDAGEMFADIIIHLFMVLFFLGIAAGLIFLGIVSWDYVTETPEKKVQIEAQKQAEATPHIYSSVDGCDVYTWRANGNQHYFTKCGSKVTTESHHSENCGKACTRDVKETIETEGNK